MPMAPREMIKHLKAHHFEVISQNGSHVKLKNFRTGQQTIVPFHSRALKKGLEDAVLKQADLR